MKNRDVTRPEWEAIAAIQEVWGQHHPFTALAYGGLLNPSIKIPMVPIGKAPDELLTLLTEMEISFAMLILGKDNHYDSVVKLQESTPSLVVWSTPSGVFGRVAHKLHKVKWDQIHERDARFCYPPEPSVAVAMVQAMETQTDELLEVAADDDEVLSAHTWAPPRGGGSEQDLDGTVEEETDEANAVVICFDSSDDEGSDESSSEGPDLHDDRVAVMQPHVENPLLKQMGSLWDSFCDKVVEVHDALTFDPCTDAINAYGALMPPINTKIWFTTTPLPEHMILAQRRGIEVVPASRRKGFYSSLPLYCAVGEKIYPDAFKGFYSPDGFVMNGLDKKPAGHNGNCIPNYRDNFTGILFEVENWWDSYWNDGPVWSQINAESYDIRVGLLASAPCYRMYTVDVQCDVFLHRAVASAGSGGFVSLNRKSLVPPDLEDDVWTMPRSDAGIDFSDEATLHLHIKKAELCLQKEHPAATALFKRTTQVLLKDNGDNWILSGRNPLSVARACVQHVNGIVLNSGVMEDTPEDGLHTWDWGDTQRYSDQCFHVARPDRPGISGNGPYVTRATQMVRSRRDS